MLLVVLEVDHVRAAEGGDRPLRRPANDLARRPGADDRLRGLPCPGSEPPIEVVVGDAVEARLTDLGYPPGRPLAAERHLDALGGQLLAQVEGLDDAVHVELAEVEDQNPHRAASFIASSRSSPQNGRGV